MSFLAPWALLLAAAAAVPLLLHLLRRRTGERVDFPALRYLLRAEREHAREVRLRNLLLMLIRVGLVLAIAAALARPIGPLPGVGHPPTALAIVLDNSASTAAVVDGRTLFDRQLAAARTLLADAREADRVSVVTFDGDVRSASREALLASLDDLQPMAGAGDPAAALRRADAVVAGSGLPERRIAVITDGQASTWAALRADSLAAVRTLWVTPSARPATRGIRALRVDPPYWSPRGSLRAELSADTASWRVAIDDRSVARGRSTDGTLLARVADAPRGWRAGLLELDADDYRGDDRRYFAVHVGDAAAVAADAGSPFLREAVATLIAAGRARAGSQVFLGAATRARRPAVLFAPADPLQLADANRALAQAGIPWRLGARREGPAPLRGPGVDGASARRWYALEALPGADADTLVRVGGAAWAVAGDDYVLVASAPDDASTDLLVRADFVPWLDMVIAERLGSADGRVVEAAAAASVTVPGGVDGLELSDGSLRPLRAGSRITAPLDAGVYFWRRGDARAGALVVNPEPAEAELAALPADSLAAQLGAARAEATPESLARATFAAGGRRALDTPLLILALALLLAESWLARRGRSTRPTD